MEPNGPYGPIRVHLVPFVHSPELHIPKGPFGSYHFVEDPLELPQGPLGVPGPDFENQYSIVALCNKS